jgi:uncharacterized NAD(P)/FAD-binding protein YdhS
MERGLAIAIVGAGMSGILMAIKHMRLQGNSNERPER